MQHLIAEAIKHQKQQGSTETKAVTETIPAKAAAAVKQVKGSKVAVSSKKQAAEDSAETADQKAETEAKTTAKEDTQAGTTAAEPAKKQEKSKQNASAKPKKAPEQEKHEIEEPVVEYGNTAEDQKLR